MRQHVVGNWEGRWRRDLLPVPLERGDLRRRIVLVCLVHCRFACGRRNRLRGVQEELGGVFDLAADVVRETTVREGHVAPPLQDDDLGTLIAPAQTRRRAHATRDSSDNHYSQVSITFYLNGLLFQPH